MDSCDVLVIGGGAAGFAAALAASSAGASVRLIRRGPGVTALSHGGWRGAPPGPVQDALAQAGLDLVPCDGPLPHPDGTQIACDVAPQSQARAGAGATAAGVGHAIGAGHTGAVGRTAGIGRTVVCGIAGLPSFRPHALAALWADAAGLPTDSFDAVTVSLDDTPAAGWSPVALATLLERAPERFGNAVARAVQGRGADRVIVPAVLGIDDHARVYRVASEAVASMTAAGGGSGAVLGEALGVAPSVPGWRLDRAMLRALADAGVHVTTGSISGSVEDAVSSTSAGAIVLATGKYLGGGISAEAEFEEPALGCDVAIERFARTIDDPGAALILSDPVRTEPQPVLSAGVQLDADGRPLGPAGDALAPNVFAAGSVLAGTETATFGLGAAAHDGWTAGLRAAAFVANRITT